jgi:hypothetical protein
MVGRPKRFAFLWCVGVAVFFQPLDASSGVLTIPIASRQTRLFVWDVADDATVGVIWHIGVFFCMWLFWAISFNRLAVFQFKSRCSLSCFFEDGQAWQPFPNG